MTTIVTRLYPDKKTADDAVAALHELGLAEGNIDRVGAGNDAADKLTAARVPEASASAYAANLDGAREVVVARAPFTPIGIALKTIKTMNGFASIDAGVANENYYIAEKADPSLFKSVDTGHGHIMSNLKPGYSTRLGLMSERWGFPMLSGRIFTGKRLMSGRTANSAIKGGRHMTGTTESLIRRGKMAGGEARGGQVMGGKTIKGKPFSDALNWKTISPRRG